MLLRKWTVIKPKHFLLFHNDVHNYKITGILKQLKFWRSLRHVSVHAGTIIREPFLCLAKTTVMVLYPRRLWRGQCHGSIPACCAGMRYTVEKGTQFSSLLHRVRCHITTTEWWHFLNILIIFNINNIDKEINKKLPEDDLIEDRNMMEWFLKCFKWF
jgi:hypothetical protein